MNPELLLVVLGAGAAAGVLAGLLGIGGGFVFVPALLFLFRAGGVPPEVAMHLAVGTSLAAIVPTSVSSIAAHSRARNVDWLAFRRLLPGLVAGAALGAALASNVSGVWLTRAFGAFLVLVAVQLAFDARPSAHRELPPPAATAVAGGVIGTLSALLGIGGGTLTAPYLVWCNRTMLRAVGTAAAAGLPIALVGASGFALLGFVDWPVAAGLGATAMLTAPLGARLAFAVSQRALRWAFAVLLAVVAIELLAA
ncbi:MAG: sulfite exporter TauE/SafE family protein [Gammaproteobacteria bacterium]